MVNLARTCVTYDAGNEGRYYCVFAGCLSRDLYRTFVCWMSTEMSRFMTYVIEWRMSWWGHLALTSLWQWYSPNVMCLSFRNFHICCLKRYRPRELYIRAKFRSQYYLFINQTRVTCNIFGMGLSQGLRMASRRYNGNMAVPIDYFYKLGIWYFKSQLWYDITMSRVIQ